MERQTREPSRQNPYRTEAKPRGTPRCEACRAVNIRGKWYSEEAARERLPAPARTRPAAPRARAKRTICPACLQLEERYPMGVVELHGAAWRAKDLLVREMIDNTERIARERNDQERVLWYQSFRNVTRYYVTLPELARHIGKMLEKSFNGSVEYHRSTEEPFLRVVWNSDPEIARAPKPRKSRHRRNRGLNRTRR
ncbi:MAG: hypothetical protein NDJ89_01025 [Oligoflexia bacterium]|nr:hypothetical protein [Oligoflexia bacterium]